MNPTAVRSILERVAVEDDEGAEERSLEEEEEDGASHSLKDVCDFGKPEPSPFSSRRVMYENEEVSNNFIINAFIRISWRWMMLSFYQVLNLLECQNYILQEFIDF